MLRDGVILKQNETIDSSQSLRIEIKKNDENFDEIEDKSENDNYNNLFSFRYRKDLLKLGFYVVGINATFLIYGLLQEKIMTRPYLNTDGQLIIFGDTLFLLLVNRAVAILVSTLFILIKTSETFSPQAPPKFYFFISCTNISSTFCQYEALKYVTFPTQTLAKCSKLISVMLMGTIIDQKIYSFIEYMLALAITLGCTLFLTNGQIIVEGQGNSSLGYILLFLNLTLDGFTSVFQDKLFKGYRMQPFNQMFYTSIGSFFLVLAAEILSGKIVDSVIFAMNTVGFIPNCLLLSLCSALGQCLINHSIKDFGAVVNSTIMILRQFLSLLLSSIIFLHPLDTFQIIGVILVFVAISTSQFLRKK